MLQWDYLGWKKLENLYFTIQFNWNQTLMTMLNQANAKYHTTEANIGSTTIRVNDNINTLLNTLEFVKDGMYTHRQIIIDNELSNEIIIVGNPDFPDINIEIQILNYDK